MIEDLPKDIKIINEEEMNDPVTVKGYFKLKAIVEQFRIMEIQCNRMRLNLDKPFQEYTFENPHWGTELEYEDEKYRLELTLKKVE